jgi:ABC-type Fe3+-hydroxamate transport system substrate-binding protein
MKTYVKYFLIGIGVIIGIVILVNILTPKVVLPQDTKDLQKKIEDLEANNLELIKKQIEIDSLTAQYDARIEDIEARLTDVGTSRVVIQKIYSDKITKSKTSTPSDLDTFFKQRYNY